MNKRILVIEDDPRYAHLIQAMLALAGGSEFELVCVERLSEGLKCLSEESPDLVLLDLSLPDSQGLATMARVQAQAPNVPIVVLTGLEDEEAAIKAMQEGAQDYLVKGEVNGNLLRRSIRYAIERKRAEEDLKNFAIGSPIGINVVQDRVFRFVSPQFQELVGYKEDELLGMNSLSIVHPEDRDTVRENAIRMLKGGHTAPYEYRYISKDGKTKWVLETVISIQYRGRRAVLGNFLDITERKQAEEALQQSEEKYKTLVDNVMVGIFRTTPGPTRRFMEVNKAMEEITGYSREELLRMDVSNLYLHPEEREAVIDEVSPTQKNVTSERNFRKKDGTTIIVVGLKTTVRDGTGAITHFDGILEDITERKRAEEALREVDRMKSEFVANVSHELRTPLHSIRGFTKLLLEGKVPEPEAQKEFLTIIDDQSQHLEELINNLLDASRIESGRFKIQKHRLLIKDVIGGVVESFYTIASEKGITINTEIPETLPEVEADGARLKQVLDNLLSNAIKFSNGSSSVTVTGAAKDGELIVRVTDQGIGMPEDAMSHLFERFYRAKDTAMVGGSGLGLYVSKQIIEAHGGHIWAESKAGEGSTFSFTLPLGQVGGDSHE